MASQASSSRSGEQPRHDDPKQAGPASGEASAGSAAPSGARLESFEAFWPYYVGEHGSAWTRRLHFVGTTAAGLCLASAIATRRPALVLGALVAGYGPAWASHFFVEKNRPATFTYPLWSLLADFKMWSMIARGTMDAEVARVLAEREAAAAHGGARTGSNGAAASDGGVQPTVTAPGSTAGSPAHGGRGVLN